MKYGFIPTPDSTCAPSGRTTHQDPSEASETGSVEYRQLSDDSLHTHSKLLTKAVATASLVAVAAAATGACWAAGLWPKAAPRIWDPDLRREFSTEPLAKSVIRKFDAYTMARGGRDDEATFKANVMNYLAPDLLYESVGFGTWSTPAGWARGEEYNYGMAFPETIFTQMLFFGDERVSTTTTYGSALWGGKLFGIKAPHQWVTLRITDFYNVREETPSHGRVTYNFMMIDWADTLRQIGRRMLPPAPLPEGIVLPPSANDGVPAPLSVLCQAEKRDPKAARVVVEAALQQDWAAAGRAEVEHWHENLTYYGPGASASHRTPRRTRSTSSAPSARPSAAARWWWISQCARGTTAACSAA